MTALLSFCFWKNLDRRAGNVWSSPAAKCDPKRRQRSTMCCCASKKFCRTANSENLAEHRMHGESFSISKEAAAKNGNAQRIVAVGTTTVRVLETVARETRRLKAVKFSNAPIRAQSGPTDLFIYPPYRFQ